MKIDEPEIAAAAMSPCRAHAPGTCPSPFYRCRVDTIRADRANVAAAMSAALNSPGPFPALRSILSALSGQGTEEAGGHGDPTSLRALIRDLRDVGTNAVPHALMGCCPDVCGEGPEAATDRDPECNACAVLTRADTYLGDMVLPGAVAPTEPGPTKGADMPIGDQGGYFVGGVGFMGQEEDSSVIDGNRAPRGQPGLWCKWAPTADLTGIEWNGHEKFYDYVEWLQYICDHFLEPWGYSLTGEVAYQGEDKSDKGKITCASVGGGRHWIAKHGKAR